MKLPDSVYRTQLERRDLLLAAMLFGGQTHYASADVKTRAVNGGFREVKKWNISEILGRASKQVPPLALRVSAGWEVTTDGIKHLAQLGVVDSSSATATVNSQLRGHLVQIQSEQIRAFVEEAVSCSEHGLNRAAVVLCWIGALSLIYEFVLKQKLAQFNAAARAKNAKWKDATTIDHFGLMDEGEFLDLIASPTVGVIGKNVKEDLKNTGLKLRNGCGHPNSMKIGPAKTAAHIEFLIQNVYSVFA